ncbi:MAG: ABC transporter permease [Synergistaceae bacterium]|jgi:simple sugar transport system permease protein|nr:ABC transporter permease [Synergistaceae bacterium]
MTGWRLEPRPAPSAVFSSAVTVLSLLAALAIGGALMAVMEVNPFAAYYEILRGSLGSWYGFSETVVKAVPITLAGLACVLPFKAAVWNIGAEGQLVAGALASVAFVRYCPGSGSAAMIAGMFLASSAAGGIWSAIPGFLKGKWGVNEIISTLMMNYVALCLMDFLLYGAWKDPMSMGFPMTAPFPESARLWVFGRTRLHGGLILALILPVAAWFALRRSQWGFEIRVIGENARAARYAGIGITKNIAAVMLVSGAIAGLCGMSEIAGLHGRLSRGFSVGYGFTGVIVAWLSGLNVLALPFAAFLMGMLLVGGETLQVVMSLPLSSVQVIQGLILFCVLGGEVLRDYRLRGPRAARPEEAE